MVDIIGVIISLWPVAPSMAAFFLFFEYYQFRKNTPADIFRKARKKKEPVMRVWRKDGIIEYVNADYGHNAVSNDKYGYFNINPEGVSTERKSGIKVIDCPEGIGINIKGWKHAAIINALKDQYNLTNYRELEGLLASYRICENEECTGHVKDKNGNITEPYHDVFEKEDKENKDETGQILSVTSIFKCPLCKAKSDTTIEPPIEIPVGENVEFGWSTSFFRHIQNPIANKIMIANAVADKMEKDKKDTMAGFVKLAGVAMVIMVVGVVLYLLITAGPQMAAQMGQMAAQAPPVVG